MFNIFITLVIGYILGSIPTGYILARCWKGIDIRQYGSGNIGTTNVWRTLGSTAGIMVLIVDFAKGLVPVLIARYCFGGTGVEISAAVGALLGHSYSAFLRFKGGKIVATGGGVIFAFSPLTGMAALTVFLVFLALFRYVSLSSMMAAITVPTAFFLLNMDLPYQVFAVLVAAFAIYRHRSNIQRIINGTEFKVSIKKDNHGRG